LDVTFQTDPVISAATTAERTSLQSAVAHPNSIQTAATTTNIPTVSHIFISLPPQLQELSNGREAPDRKRMIIRSPDGAARSVRAIAAVKWAAKKRSGFADPP